MRIQQHCIIISIAKLELFRMSLFVLFIWLTLTLSTAARADSDIKITNTNQEEILVFLPTSLRTGSVGEHFNSSCPHLAFRAYGQAREFHKQIKDRNVLGYISIGPISSLYTQYHKKIQGFKNNAHTVSLLLASIKPYALKDIQTQKDIRIGTLDLLGRKSTISYVRNIISSPKLRVKRTAKQEDLLPLISFNVANALLINEHQFKIMKTRSELNFNTIKLDTEQILPALFIHKNKTNNFDASKVVKCLNSLKESLMDTIGIDTWRAE